VLTGRFSSSTAVVHSASYAPGKANRVAAYQWKCCGVNTAEQKKFCLHTGSSFPIRYINFKINFNLTMFTLYTICTSKNYLDTNLSCSLPDLDLGLWAFLGYQSLQVCCALGPRVPVLWRPGAPFRTLVPKAPEQLQAPKSCSWYFVCSHLSYGYVA